MHQFVNIHIHSNVLSHHNISFNPLFENNNYCMIFNIIKSLFTNKKSYKFVYKIKSILIFTHAIDFICREKN